MVLSDVSHNMYGFVEKPASLPFSSPERHIFNICKCTSTVQETQLDAICTARFWELTFRRYMGEFESPYWQFERNFPLLFITQFE